MMTDSIKYVSPAAKPDCADHNKFDKSLDREEFVKIRIQVDKEAAIKEGKSHYGRTVVPVPWPKLTSLHREELARWRDAEKISPEADFYLDYIGLYDGPRRPLLSEATPDVVIQLLDKLITWRGRQPEQIAEMKRWINASGSQYLRSFIEPGIECIATYRDERLRAERPDWRWHVWCLDRAFWIGDSEYGDYDLVVHGGLEEVKYPDNNNRALLARARQVDADGSLKLCYDSEGFTFNETAVASEWLGRPAIYMNKYPSK